MKTKGLRLTVVQGAIFLVFIGGLAAAEDGKALRWKDGLWRVEASSFAGLKSGRKSRTGDFNVNGTVEYEIPAGNRSTVGIRVHPLFLYEENLTNRSIWGTAGGMTVRVYENAEFRRGFYGEAAGSVLWHSNEFRGNKSRTNFLVEVGLGYKFDNDWHVAVKGRHISNSGIASRNSGINGLGAAFGYTF